MTKRQKTLLQEKYIEDFYARSKNVRAVSPNAYKGAKKRIRDLRARFNSSNAKPPTDVEKMALRKIIAFHRDDGTLEKNAQSIEQIARDIAIFDMTALMRIHPEDAEEFCEFLLDDSTGLPVVTSLNDLYKRFDGDGFKRRIRELVKTDPKEEFPETRQMVRHFILHVGETNSGKTYDALEDLKKAENGAYAGPLRLLALEVFEKMTDCGIKCSMLTGEEHIYVDESTILSATAEMIDVSKHYDIAVIDEAQMIGDADRGGSWTRLILGLMADRIHICMSPDAENLVKSIIELCGDEIETVYHKRKTPLIMETEPCDIDNVVPGDAVIVFSKHAVLDMAGRLEMEGFHPSVIYGNLPPEIRRRQVERFLKGKNDIVVSTDAIGMGINLPIKRIVFAQGSKYDGHSTRLLKGDEVRQIAGRAGRYGMHENGYVTATNKSILSHVKNVYKEPEEITKARLGFPTVLLDMDEPLAEILKAWHDISPASEVFEKVSVNEMIELLSKLESIKEFIDGYEDKHILFQMITCDVDIKNNKVVELWERYCMSYTADVCMDKPHKSRSDNSLEGLETYYKKLGLYHHFSNKFGKEIDELWLSKERMKTEDAIMRELAQSKKGYVRMCRYCGRVLPVEERFGICEKCFSGSRRNSWRYKDFKEDYLD
ncbi:MAG: ATP-dependent helicase [Lachnospiraceae bacterium]|nr:ATP-dependent helicase [Lachnospiraceae bacterium]